MRMLQVVANATNAASATSLFLPIAIRIFLSGPPGRTYKVAATHKLERLAQAFRIHFRVLPVFGFKNLDFT